jgi:hypothetical protein
MRPGFRLFILSFLLINLLVQDVFAQSGKTLLEVFRSQAKELTEEISLKVPEGKISSLYVSVQGTELSLLFENAILETFSKRSTPIVFVKQDEKATPRINILVLKNESFVRSIEPSIYLRTIETTMEVRFDSSETAKHYLGTFNRILKDTVSQSDGNEGSFTVINRSTLHVEDEKLNKILLPAILISSTILIVYLFFTVRN